MMRINLTMASFVGAVEPSKAHPYALTTIEDMGSDSPSRAVRPLIFFQGKEAWFQSLLSGLPEMVYRKRITVSQSKAVTVVARNLEKRYTGLNTHPVVGDSSQK